MVIGNRTGRKIITQEEFVEQLPRPRGFVQPNDRVYILCRDEEVLEVLRGAGIFDGGRGYQQERNDCDDYAFRAFGVLKGRGWSVAAMKVILDDTSGHYIVGWLNEDFVWRDLEVQTGEYIPARRIIRRPSIIA